jgi:ribosome-binding protein aMBF1 (putative translation factor)
MKQAIQSANASSEPTKNFEKVFSQHGAATETGSQIHCQVYNLEDYTAPNPQTPTKYKAIGKLVGEWEKDDSRRAALEEARQWVADTLYGEDGDTVRTIRLSKGWSQTRLANELSTSQSHVARIEGGTENIAIGTCRRLCAALQVDMNTLDEALKRQETIAQAKHK